MCATGEKDTLDEKDNACYVEYGKDRLYIKAFSLERSELPFAIVYQSSLLARSLALVARSADVPLIIYISYDCIYTFRSTTSKCT